MPNLFCPHCHTNVPHGARVCTGCQAEIEYGTPLAAFLIAFLASGFLGWKIGAATYPVLGWILFGVLLAGGWYVSWRIFKDRINFKRIYRTK
jgi:hypothetical protein